jgi:hypothetical protein
MTLWKYLGPVALLAVGVAMAGRAQETPGNSGQEKPTRSNQVLMRDKLTHANAVLEGLTAPDFAKIVENAKMLRMISKAASWHVLDSDEYTRMSKDFQEQTTDLERHAKDKNLDAAALDYMRISMTCVGCHKMVRRQSKIDKGN